MPRKAHATNLPLGYARAFIIVMVVLHHSVLAYFTKGPHPVTSMLTMPRWWEAFPVVDPAKWRGYTPFVIFNDSYTMELLFFVSALFSWRSLKQKGPGAYWKSRLLRLGLPLLFMMLISPATYYTVYLQGHLQDGFWQEWFRLQNWPLGPAWFLFALLVLDAFAILLFNIAPRLVETTGSLLARIRNAYIMVLLFTVIPLIPFLPCFLRFGFYNSGILFIPIARFAHYFVYFLFGLALGSVTVAAGKEDNTLISPGGPLAQQWLPLSALAVLAFSLWQVSNHLSHTHFASILWLVLTGIAFCLSVAVSTFAVLAVFLRFVKRPNFMADHLLACSFGIYLIHHFVVAWLQYRLLPIAAPGSLKGPLVFFLAMGICWTLTAFARRSKLIARII